MDEHETAVLRAEGPACVDETLAVIHALRARGIRRQVAMVRHSAREFVPGRHDLQNPLTERGRALARALGAGLAPEAFVRAYASPVARCLDTAELAREAHAGNGGEGQRHRALEGMGLFYVLDQVRMWKGMQTHPAGMPGFLRSWFDGHLPPDVMMPAQLAAGCILGVLTGKLAEHAERDAIDICVSHDMCLYLVREMLMGASYEAYGEVPFLDGVVLYAEDGELWLASRLGDPVRVRS